MGFLKFYGYEFNYFNYFIDTTNYSINLKPEPQRGNHNFYLKVEGEASFIGHQIQFEYISLAFYQAYLRLLFPYYLPNDHDQFPIISNIIEIREYFVDYSI